MANIGNILLEYDPNTESKYIYKFSFLNYKPKKFLFYFLLKKKYINRKTRI